jgi:hypothetical protein
MLTREHLVPVGPPKGLSARYREEVSSEDERRPRGRTRHWV